MNELSTDNKAHVEASETPTRPTGRRRILLLTPSLHGNSLYAPHAESLATQLRQEGLAVTLASLHPMNYTNGHKTLITKLRHIGGDQWASLRGLYQLISQHDVIHVFVIPPAELAESSLHAVMIARFLGKQIILTLAGGTVEESTNKFNGLLVPVLRLAQKVVVYSEHAARHLARHGLPVVLAPLVDTAAVSPRQISAVQPKILTVMGAGPDSNITALLRAYQLVKQKYPRIELKIVGPQKRLRAFEQTVPSNNGTSFVYSYSQENLRGAWQEADLYVNPSSDDDLPVGVITAFRLGIPVLTADGPGIGQVVRDGVTGVIFPANDHLALADRIIELVEQPARVASLSQGASAEASRYEWSAIRQQWLSVYSLR